MPGVFRDRNGETYSYQATNDFEDRRRRDLDASRSWRPPTDPRPPITWLPPAPAVPTTGADIPSPTSTPAADWIQQLQIQISADYAAAQKRAENEALFDRLVNNLPNRVGESPTFDQLFDEPGVPIISAQDLIAQLEQ